MQSRHKCGRARESFFYLVMNKLHSWVMEGGKELNLGCFGGGARIEVFYVFCNNASLRKFSVKHH